MVDIDIVAHPRRLLVGTPGTLRARVHADGEPATLAGGSPTFAAVDADGNAIASGAATITGNILEAALTAAQVAEPNRITCTWGAFTVNGGSAVSLATQHEAVGSSFLTLAEARAFEEKKLNDRGRFPDVVLYEAFARAQDDLEHPRALGYSLGLRYKRAQIAVDTGTGEVFLTDRYINEIRGISYRLPGSGSFTALSSGDLARVEFDDSGALTGYHWQNGSILRISYVAGLVPIPTTLKHAGLHIVADVVSSPSIPRNAIQQVGENGTFTLSTPGLRGARFGIPFVDEAVKTYRWRAPGFA